MSLTMQQISPIGGLYLDPTGEIGTKNVILHLEPVKKALGFLDLPREIRDYVYEIMFLKEEPLYPSLERAGIAPYLGFLQTNHQVYAEAIDVLYSRNTLQIRAHPAWKAPELLNLIASQKRDNHLFGLRSTLDNNKACQARFSLKKLYIPSHNISLDRLKHLISLLKCFPNLTHLKIIYLASTGIADMEVVNICRMLRDRRPLLKNFVLCKRIAYKEAEDISWMLWEMPYNTWTSVMDEETWTRVWKNQDGVVRKAEVFNAPQSIPE